MPRAPAYNKDFIKGYFDLKKIDFPLLEKDILKISAGDIVSLSGVIYTARDQAHIRLNQMILNNEPLPFCLKNQTIYYAGPAPAKPGGIIGSCGPTTSGRMDSLTPPLLNSGLKGMIGKGNRSGEVIESMIKNKCVYFSATGGAAALIASRVESCECVAFPELLSEAVYKLKVNDFQVVVAIDCFGNSLFK